MHTLWSLLRQEYSLFRQLSWKVRRFMISVVLFETVKPAFVFFTNTYLWRMSGEMHTIILYNIGIFAFVVVGFYLNTLLLRTVRLQWLYSAGAVAMGLSTLGMFILPISGLSALLLGCLFGLPTGIYWANRHIIKQVLTTSENRNFISGLEIALATPSIITPVLIGWVIAGGETTQWYTPEIAYWMVMGTTTITLALSGWVFHTVYMPNLCHQAVAIWHTTPEWNMMRVAKFFEGMQGGVTIVMPTVMILYILGSEGEVGTTMTIATLLSTVLVYQLSKKTLPRHRAGVTLASCAVMCLPALGLITSLSAFWVMSFVLITQVAGRFLLANFTPLVMDMIDTHTSQAPNTGPAYIADAELFVNLGRIVALLCVAASLQAGPMTGMRVGAGLVAVSFLLLMYTVRVLTGTRFRPLLMSAYAITFAKLSHKPHH